MRTQELKDRVEAKKHQMMARMSELKADTRAKASAEIERIQNALSQLETTLKETGGQINDRIASKLSSWLDRNDDDTNKQSTATN